MMSKHTQGPFKVIKFKNNDGSLYVALHTKNEAGHDVKCVCEWRNATSEDEATANFFAAAPELLEALKVFVMDWEGDEHESLPDMMDRHYKVFRAAIAKATGEA